MKKAVIVSCFGSYFFEERLKYIYRSLVKYDYEVKILMSNFNHTKKEEIKLGTYPNYVELIPTREYRSNISISRVLSHMDFAKEISRKIENISPDIIYYLMPPNIVGKVISNYKNKHDSCFLIADVMDLWPESFPIPCFHSRVNVLGKIWRSIRTKSLKNTDYTIFECGLYKRQLGIDNNCQVIYLPMRKFKQEETSDHVINNHSVLKIAYIGQVSHIVDMDLIENILKKINIKQQLELHVIGTGTNYDNFIDRIKGVVTKVYEYGPIYEDDKIQQLIGDCHFGLNIMKDNVQVGLTMKSMIYIGLGIPLINNIKGDTWELVDQYGVGINVLGGALQYDDIMKYQEMCKNMKRLQKNIFSPIAIQKKFDDVIGSIVTMLDRGGLICKS